MDVLAEAFKLARRKEQMYDEIAKVQSNYPDVLANDDPYEGPPRYQLRCYNCGQTHPACGFYPILGIMGPMTHGREMQICNDCDEHLREDVRLRERAAG